MQDRILYHTPGSCSRVALNALEEIGAPYREHAMALMTGAQYQPDYLAINPKGKVPVLVENGTAITELPVMLYHLAVAHPTARLLPVDANGVPTLASLSDLVWIAGALHPTVHRIFRPDATSSADPDGVKAIAMTQLAHYAETISARFANDRWWYGDTWSVVDLFIAWIFGLASQCGFPLDDFPVLTDHRARVEARPSFVRALALEREITGREKLAMPPGFSL